MATLPLVAQTTVTVPCAADNTLYETIFGDASNGAGPALFIGLNAFGSFRRAVLKFDVAAAVPAGASILTARLTMNVNKANPTQTQPVAITAHRLTVSWGEGTSSTGPTTGGGGALASVGDATWLHRFSPATLWTNPGGDFAVAPSLTAAMPLLGPFTSAHSQKAAADVQGWLDAPASNFGWVLRTAEVASRTARRLDSRESTSVGARPTLSITYLLPGQNGMFGTGCRVGAGAMTAAFVGAPVGGTTIQIVKTNGTPSSLGADFFALALNPAGTLLGSGCTAYLPLGEVLLGGTFPTDAAGGATTSLLLPPGFPGYLVQCQAAVLATNPLGYVVSNAALTVLQ
ncbi:MAG: DNRLRE domain-containing protein [Planctomycetota bacterium]